MRIFKISLLAAFKYTIKFSCPLESMGDWFQEPLGCQNTFVLKSLQLALHNHGFYMHGYRQPTVLLLVTMLNITSPELNCLRYILIFFYEQKYIISEIYFKIIFLTMCVCVCVCVCIYIYFFF